MGRPGKDSKSNNPHPTPGYRDVDDGASMSSAMSLQEDMAPAAPSYEDGEMIDDSVPPPYTDDETAPLTAATPSIPSTSSQPLPRAPDTLDDNVESWIHQNWKGSVYTRLSPTLTTDPVKLEEYLRWEATQIPRAYIRVQGYHTEQRRDHDGKSKRTERVEDFDFKVNVNDTFTNGPVQESRYNQPWRAVVPVENATKTYRGTRLKKRSDYTSRSTGLEAAEEKPSLKEWCHLFCASSAPAKTFTLRRVIAGRNTKYLTEQITAMIRDTNYRGNITVTYPLHDRKVEIISPHVVNRLRHSKFVWWACIILQLWIITWPLLFLMTRRWEVVDADYYYSTENTDDRNFDRLFWKESEEAWCKRWKHTMQQTALSKVTGGAEVAAPVNVVEDNARRQIEELARRNSEQQSGFVGGALALLRGASNIHREMNTSMGWGYDR